MIFQQLVAVAAVVAVAVELRIWLLLLKSKKLSIFLWRGQGAPPLTKSEKNYSH